MKEDKLEKHTAQIFFVIFIFVLIFGLVLGFIMGLRVVSFENNKCSPSQEHQVLNTGLLSYCGHQENDTSPKLNLLYIYIK